MGLGLGGIGAAGEIYTGDGSCGRYAAAEAISGPKSGRCRGSVPDALQLGRRCGYL